MSVGAERRVIYGPIRSVHVRAIDIPFTSWLMKGCFHPETVTLKISIPWRHVLP
jgi:hypothetical protein